jgi:hypothetical protein
LAVVTATLLMLRYTRVVWTSLVSFKYQGFYRKLHFYYNPSSPLQVFSQRDGGSRCKHQFGYHSYSKFFGLNFYLKTTSCSWFFMPL